MDLPNLENYPVYILNVVPELTEENNVELPQQITSSQPLSYNFYIPPVEHQDPMLSTETVSTIVSQKNKTKQIKKISHKKKPPKVTTVNNSQKIG